MWLENQIKKVKKNDLKENLERDFVFDKRNRLQPTLEVQSENEAETETTQVEIKDLKETGMDKIQRQRKQLPIFNHRQKILETIAKNPVTILVGETGSGKTTQIP